MPEFLHEVVKKRERDAEYRTLRIEPPRIGLPADFMEMMRRDMEASIARMNQGDTLINIEGSVYVRRASIYQVTDATRRHLSHHAQWFDSNEELNTGTHSHRWVLDYATQPDRILRQYHYTCADCGRQNVASVAGG
jgi:hypothetical protein